MQRATTILFTVAFTIASVGLWYLICIAESIYPPEWSRPGNLDQYSKFFHENKFLFLVVPIPFLLFSAFIAIRKRPTTEINLFYAAILAIIFSFLFFSVVLAVLFPWISRT